MSNQDWLNWRAQGLGASDAPTIMGVSPWSTPYQLWEEKTGLVKRESNNWATKRGNELEPIARAHYELLNNIDMPVAFLEHKEFPFIRASLDGYNESERVVLEIKCPGKDDHETAKQGKVPDKYWPQVQQQLLVTDAERVDYFSFDGTSGVVVKVYPDKDYILKLVEKLVEFWGYVQTKEPPPLTDADYKKVTDPDLKSMLDEYSKNYVAIKDLEKNQDALKKKILAAASHPNMSYGDMKVYRSFRRGNVDYSAIPEIQNIDLEKYRKPGSFTHTIRVGK